MAEDKNKNKNLNLDAASKTQLPPENDANSSENGDGNANSNSHDLIDPENATLLIENARLNARLRKEREEMEKELAELKKIREFNFTQLEKERDNGHVSF